MKRFRPYCGGFILVYVLSAAAVADAIYTLIAQFTGTLNEFMSSFTFFTYIIAILCIPFVRMYATTKVVTDGVTFSYASPFSIRPAKDAKRASFLFRQGELDLHQVKKHFNLADVEQYGYIENMGFASLDQTGAKPDSKLFPVHEMAFVMKNGKRYHWNAAHYSKKQLEQIMELIKTGTGKSPVTKA